jgi:hypothetical protein
MRGLAYCPHTQALLLENDMAGENKQLNAQEARGVKMAATLAEEMLREAQKIVSEVTTGGTDSALVSGVVQGMAALYAANMAANR